LRCLAQPEIDVLGVAAALARRVAKIFLTDSVAHADEHGIPPSIYT
jgi:hypothetical protein